MEHPSVRQVTEKLGWFRNPSRSEYDLAIYGGGPAGLSASVYGASEGLKTVLVERLTVGGQAGTSPKIENYLGFPKGISGADLAERAREQAAKFGAEILIHRAGVRGEFSTGKGVVELDDGTRLISRVSVCATGVEYRRLGLPNEDKLFGAGVYYGAGASEAQLCGNEHVVIVGAGNSSAQASLYLARYARKVSIVMRGERLNDNVSEYLVDRVMHTPNIEIVPRTVVVALHGDVMLQAATLRNCDTGQERTIETSFLFLCLGGVPNTQWAKEVGIVRDEEGYLVTGPDLRKFDPMSEIMEVEPRTLLPRNFHAGRVCGGRCAARLDQARCLRRRRGCDDDRFCASLSRFRITGLATSSAVAVPEKSGGIDHSQNKCRQSQHHA